MRASLSVVYANSPLRVIMWGARNETASTSPAESRTARRRNRILTATYRVSMSCDVNNGDSIAPKSALCAQAVHNLARWCSECRNLSYGLLT